MEQRLCIFSYLEPYSLHIPFYDLASLGSLFMGLTLALLLGLAKKADRPANLFLSIALLVTILNTGRITVLFFPLLGPLLHLYIRKLAYPKRPLHWLDGLHGAWVFAGYWMPGWLVLLLIGVYSGLSYRLIQDFYRRLRPVLMDRPRYAFRWVERVLFAICLCCVLTAFNAVFYWGIALVLMVMAAAALLKPDTDSQLTKGVTDRADARDKGRRLKELIMADRLYEDAGLTLTTLALKLDIHPHDLSRIINQGLEKNFSDLINEFRVRDVIRKMRDPACQRLTLLGIAYGSGFNSKTTFNRVFKELTGKTPVVYKTDLEKEVPIDKMAPWARAQPLLLRLESPAMPPGNKWYRDHMFRNYFKITFRNLLQSKVYSFINILGLSFGLACAMLILLYVQDELSYDRFHSNVSQLYRIDKRTTKGDGSVSNGSYTGYFPGPRFAANIPEIQHFVRFQPAQADIRTGTDIRLQAVCFADTNFFSVFNFPLLSGNARTALAEPNSVVISEDAARRYFGHSNALGKTISIRRDSIFRPFVVTGIARDCPQNSSIKFEVLLPLRVSAADENDNGNWFNSFLSTFVVLSPGADSRTVQNKMDRVFEADAGKAISEIKKRYGVKDIGISYLLEPLTAVHLGNMVTAGNEILRDKSDPKAAYILSAIAIFILLIACINFINLTIARSVKRAKEIGIRKVIGGSSSQLRIQFLSESFLLCLVAFVLALALAALVLPLFGRLSGKALSLAYLLDARLIWEYILLFIITGLLAGIYPALVLSGYRPVETLYSRFDLAGKGYLQKVLVVFQFALAAFLIMGAITIFFQFNYLTSQSLGYDDHDLIVLNCPRLSRDEAALFEQELIKAPSIVGVAAKNGGDNNNTVKVNGDQQVNIAVEIIDPAFLTLLKIPVIAGRDLSENRPADALHSALVNEAFVQEAGWKHPLGEQIQTFDGGTYTVTGVVKNYHYKPLTEKIGPQFFTMATTNNYGLLYIKIRPGTGTASLRHLASTFKRVFPMSPFIYVFEQERNAQRYAAEGRWKQIILFSAILTIFIACIGLFGLSVLAVEKRVKEIGVRKALGASVSRIVTLLSLDFLKLIFVALAIALPGAWLATNQWLQHYPYRITLAWWIFASGGVLVLLLALLTISFRSVNAALANPVRSLRRE